eukprot:1119215-Pelagomonas_calceolata.AAC.4
MPAAGLQSQIDASVQVSWVAKPDGAPVQGCGSLRTSSLGSLQPACFLQACHRPACFFKECHGPACFLQECHRPVHGRAELGGCTRAYMKKNPFLLQYDNSKAAAFATKGKESAVTY